jgi:DMSO/TMAO reductase YedYZ heme-binding membrane subunit
VSSELVWIVLRVLGLIALLALTVSVASGLAGPGVRTPARRAALVSVHRAGAVIGLALTLGHVVVAVLDPWVEISWAAVVVPGLSAWEPLWVAAGAVAVDLLLVVAVTSALRGRGPRTWWALHVLTYPAWLLATAHALAVGTDATRTPYLVAGASGLALVGAAAVVRARAHSVGSPAGVRPRPVLEPERSLV